MDALIRNIPESTMQSIASLAAQAHLSREAFLRLKMEEIAKTTWTPSRFGEGFKAFTPTGGSCILKRLGDESSQIQQGAKNLSQDEFDAYKRAALVASPINGSDWQKAKLILEAAGFEVFNV